MKNVINWKKNPENSDKHYRLHEKTSKVWFDEKCAKKNEEKNAARERAIQNNIRGVKNAYKLARTEERRLFRKKSKAAR
jgi:hypothetical protein